MPSRLSCFMMKDQKIHLIWISPILLNLINLVDVNLIGILFVFGLLVPIVSKCVFFGKSYYHELRSCRLNWRDVMPKLVGRFYVISSG
jgi:hypothetical protein